jgi:hypothetical protein
MATRMQQRKGTAAQWAAADPILNAGEIGWESDTNKFKIGDGINHWDDLTYFLDSTDTGFSAEDYLLATSKNAANGVAALDANVNVVTTTGVVFEGATADSYEITLAVTDPTADHTITLPDATGTVVLTTTLDEMAQDAVNTALTAGTGIVKNYNDNANTITLSVDTATIQARVADVSDTEIGYLNGVTSAIQTQLDAKLALAGGTMTGAIAMGTNKITGLGTPTDSADAATKAYVDAVTEGLHIHPSVVAATTANVTLSSALENGDTLDGITLATNDRILVKNQTTQSENGIYVVQASGQPTRATDFDTAAEVDSGDFVFVSSGTVNGSTGWVQTNKPATIGTDAIAFTQFSGAGTYAAGTGLTLTGNTFSANIGTDIQAYNATLAAVAGGTYTGDDSITTLGTISAGTWNGTTIAIANGGTGQTTAMAAASALLPSQASNSGKYLTTDGAGTLSWAAVQGYSAPTLGSTSIASGATVTTISGLTLASATATTALTLNATAELRLADTDSSHYVGFKAPATVSTNRIWTLPSADGSADQVLKTDGSGTLAWTTPAQGAAFSELMLIGA